jgi:SAM-dependent methyltransferase
MSENPKLEGSFDLRGRKVMLGLPTYDFKISAKLAISLASFCVQAQQHGVDIQICNISGCSVVSRVRNLIASDFLQSDCTDLMFIDSDINFDAEDIFRLMAWNIDPKKGIVAGIPVARKKGKVYISTLDTDDNEHIFMDKMGLVRAKRVATAFMMIRRDVFTQLKDAHPEWVYHDEKKVGDEMIAFFDFALKDGNYIGEDFLFCDRARELGFEVWIDPTIKLGHMGVEEFAGSFGEDYLYPLLRPVDSKKDAA